MKSRAFQYHAPATVDEAVSCLSELGEVAKPIAGGQSLVPILALRLTTFEHLVDLGRIEELTGIESGDAALRIGAATTQSAIEISSEVEASVPLLARATPLIGHFQIRNRGTLGGSIAHADPASEYPAVALALDALIETRSARGERILPAADFFTGTWTTQLADDEILTAVRFPTWGRRSGFAIEELTRRHGDFAIAGAAIGVELDGAGSFARCAVSLFGLGSTPERATAVEQRVRGVAASDVDADELGSLAIASLGSVPSDLHGSEAFRRRVGAEMVARAWRRAVEEARHA